MAPVLPLNCSGDFGTSPFIGQLSGKPRLAYNSQVALPHPEHNSSSKRLSVSVTVGFDRLRRVRNGGGLVFSRVEWDFFADFDPPQTFVLRADEILGNERQTVWSSGRAWKRNAVSVGPFVGTAW